MTLVYEQVEEEHILFLRANGFRFIETKTEYEAQRLEKNGATAIWYTSGKLVIQGKEQELDRIAQLVQQIQLIAKSNKEKKQTTKEYDFNSKEHIGSDETLKGDTFGGLIVVAFSYEPQLQEELEQLGVKDSKQLSTNKIIQLAQTLITQYQERFAMYELRPKEYNELTQAKGTTTILNEAHQLLAQKLSPDILHVVDKYPGCSVGDEQITKGEEHSLAIAAASIVARYLALQQFDMLSELAGFTLPKGSTHVQTALEKLREQNKNFSEFTKLHFKNVQTFLQ